MNAPSSLSISDAAMAEAFSHLYPGDGKEAAAILLCAFVPGPRFKLVVKELLKVPHDACSQRHADALNWPGAWIEQAIDRGESGGLALILIHSHPGGLFAFSAVDDASDRAVLPSIFHAYGDFHGSAVMTPDGAILARIYRSDMSVFPIDLVAVPGDDIKLWWRDDRSSLRQRPLAFSAAMKSELARLSAAVVGVSGTGSIVTEQLARLGIGRLTLIDFDRVEEKNLNRILNSTTEDASSQRLKVDMFAQAIAAYSPSTSVEAVDTSILSREGVIAASQADVLFSCVDTMEARQICDLIASAFLVPLIDVGVVIPLRRKGDSSAIGDVCGRVDYVKPGGTTLGDRQVYTAEGLRAEYLRSSAQDAHQQELDAGYIKGAIDEAPAVITLNMRAASAAANEFIARAYPFRHDANSKFARTEFSLAAAEEEYFSDSYYPKSPNHVIGRGGMEPLLGLPVLADLDRRSV